MPFSTLPAEILPGQRTIQGTRNAPSNMLLLIAVPVALYLDGTAAFAAGAVAGIFALQYLMAAVAAQQGIRLVTNVIGDSRGGR